MEFEEIEMPIIGNTSWLIGKAKKLAIVGTSDSKIYAPFLFDPQKPEDAWEIWGVNNGFQEYSRWTRWFELHPITLRDGKYMRRRQTAAGVFEFDENFRGLKVSDYIERLNGLGCPIYMQQHWDIISKSEAYPLDKIIDRFGGYFTNTISYMIALGIDQGFREIGIYGADMAVGSEYGYQRPSCEFMLGVAAGLGISLTIPQQSDLLKTRFLYAFHEREQTMWERKIDLIVGAMEKRQQKAVQLKAQAEKQIEQFAGGIRALRDSKRIWANLLTLKDWED